MNLMDGVWARGRARGYGMTALMAVVVFGASATAADALRSAGDEQPAGDVFVTPTETPTPTPAETPASTSAEPTTPAIAPTPEPQAVVTKSPTVQAVTTPEPQAPTTPEPDPAIGNVGNDGRYTPAPVQPKAGEPPVLPDPGSEPAPVAPRGLPPMG